MDRIFFALLLILTVTSCAEQQVRTSGDFSDIGAKPYKEAKAPKMDPARKVAQQDCRQPLTDDAGNLLCTD